MDSIFEGGEYMKPTEQEEKEMWEWLNQENCSKCGVNTVPKNSDYYHCEKCRNLRRDGE